MIIRIIIWVFGIFVLSRIVLNYENKKLKAKQLIFWVIVWIMVVGITTWPYLTDKLANYLGVQRGVDVAVYLAIVLLFYLVFRIYVVMFDIESEITSIAKEVALKDLKKRKK